MAVELENGTENLLQQTRSKSAKLRGHSTAKKKKEKWRDWKYSKVKNATAWKNELEKQIETEKRYLKKVSGKGNGNGKGILRNYRDYKIMSHW